MSKERSNREDFIKLYRRKLRNDLDNMGYPGGIENGPASDSPLIIDAGSEFPDLNRDAASRTQLKVSHQ